MDQRTNKSKMKDLLNQLLTGRDNKTHDIARWSWLITTLVVIAGALYDAYTSNMFNIKDLYSAGNSTMNIIWCIVH